MLNDLKIERIEKIGKHASYIGIGIFFSSMLTIVYIDAVKSYAVSIMLGTFIFNLILQVAVLSAKQAAILRVLKNR